MTAEAWMIVAIIAAALFIIAVGAWIYASKARGRHGGHSRRTEDEVAALRSEFDSMKDRGRLLEERFERYERSQVETRDALDGIREDVDARLTRASSQDTAHRELQEQIHEIRKEHQVLMERDERHERRVLELQEQLGALRTELSTRRDGSKVRA
jgi:chromosome segregation ATPase